MSIDKRPLELLEDLPLEALDAWYVMLVYLGLKSGAWIIAESEVWRKGDAPVRICQHTLDKIELSLHELGLFYQIDLRETEAGLWQPEGDGRQRLNQLADIYIAKDKDVLDAIVRARKTNDHTLLGLSLGFPKTAVEAFETDRKIFIKDLEPRVQLSEAGQFTYFALSKDHWREELGVVEEWIAAVKKNSSILWNELRRDVNFLDDKLIDLVVRSKEG